ncbi:hypothetical protein SPRG_11477 [Saprolegnia parasitica CBS 223.65]|uniref:RING-type domain-containing protein n=1 Tax=Saprolegnia parasitica (strain CBS 223.65) TaxID=695850 RepID=A0A067C2L4_SAPPC|nr:hypothetical protein SPRG_11477 [Saprolegnia parasitica CBS 223.65]KDO23385.1 hypothetical protein SPRG_11477 [Saprolegnia parasitica CBS 223.65]|eukprot:XP_012205875.1 hypothetical protein SPRG_11477 [Saprolegnia parasitica CBS 223.65]
MAAAANATTPNATTAYPVISSHAADPPYAKALVGVAVVFVFVVGFIACYIVVRRAAAYGRQTSAPPSAVELEHDEPLSPWFKQNTSPSHHLEASVQHRSRAEMASSSPLAIASPRETDATTGTSEYSLYTDAIELRRGSSGLQTTTHPGPSHRCSMRRSRYFRAPPSADPSGDAATTCAICLQAVVAGATIACRHRFCFACIRAWTDVSSTCPLCKVDIRAILNEATRTEVVIAPKVQAPPAENDHFAFSDDDFADADDDVALALDADDASDGYEMDGFVVPNDFIEFEDSQDEADLRT